MAQAVASETKKPVGTAASQADAPATPRAPRKPKAAAAEPRATEARGGEAPVRSGREAPAREAPVRKTRATKALLAASRDTDTTARRAVEGGLRNEVVGIGILAASLCLMLALASFHIDDVSQHGQAALTGQAHNLIGPVGAFVADILLYIFGAAAFLLPVTLALPGLAFVTGRSIKVRIADAVGYPFLIFFGAMAAHLWMEGQAVLGHPAGGFIGAHGAEILQALLGRTGAYIVVYAVISLTFIVTTRISLVKIVGAATGPVARRARTASEEARKSAEQLAGSVRTRLTDRFKNWRLRRNEVVARQRALRVELGRRKAEAKAEAAARKEAEKALRQDAKARMAELKARSSDKTKERPEAPHRLDRPASERPERPGSERPGSERPAPPARPTETEERASGGWRLRRPKTHQSAPGDTGGFSLGDVPDRHTGGFSLGVDDRSRKSARSERPAPPAPNTDVRGAEKPVRTTPAPEVREQAPAARAADKPRTTPAAEKPARGKAAETPRARPAVELEAPTTLQPVLSADDLEVELVDGNDTAFHPALDAHHDSVSAPVVHRRIAPAELQLDMPLPGQPAADWEFPPLRFLDFVRTDEIEIDPVKLQAQADRLVEALSTFKIEGRVTEIHPGPVVTMFEFEPAPGVRISRIASLADDLAMALKAIRVRIVAPIPGKGVVGFEVPNAQREMVYLQEIIASPAFRDKKNTLPMALGKDIHGNAVFTDLAKMPHLLVAGTTGSGKSVGVNGMITSLLYHASPDDVRFIMVDPKMLELSVYEGIPHLLLPVVTDARKAAAALNWAVTEMDRRYEVMKDAGVRNIKGYNKGLERWMAGERGEEVPDFTSELGEEPTRMPYIVVVIDEFADLMMVAGKEVEYCVARIAQKARAAGIHLILATQRPSIDVITGVIKANFPTRIAFRVSSGIDSRTILSTNGAEHLLGNGDMLFVPPGTSRLDRVHGAFVDEHEIARIVDFVKAQREPEYLDPSVLETAEDGEGDADGEGADDPMYEECVRCVFRDGRASTSHLQRRLSLGYNRAARIVDQMERDGLVGPGQGAKPRTVNKQVMAELINRWDAA
jgi:DNA segregation ATPase FtsK/SpoIIIE-like protein